MLDTAAWHMWWKRSGASGLRQILMEEWDPIGVRGVPEAADEYDSYLPSIVSRLGNNMGDEQVAEYLTEIEEVQMGLIPSDAARKRNGRLAELLRAWYAQEMAAAKE